MSNTLKVFFAQRHPGTDICTDADKHDTSWQHLSEKTAIVSFVLPRFLMMAPKASKRSLRERVVAADFAEQFETPSSSQGPVSVATDSSSSVRNKVRSTTKRRTEVSDGVADI